MPRLAVLRAAPPRVRDRARRLGAAALGHAHGHDRADVDATCRSLVRSLGEPAGSRHAVAGRAHGGAGDAIDTRAICLARETLARHSGLADFAFAMQGLGSGAISLAGTAEQKAPLPAARRRRRGDRRVRAVRARRRLRRRRDGAARRAPTATRYVLDGEKTWISQRRHRRLLRRVRAHRRRRDPARRARAASRAFIVDAGTPGFEIAERIDVIAPHPLARLRFNGCRVPPTQPHRRRRRGLQGRDAHARRLPHLGRRRRARLRAPRARRGACARDPRQDVRPASSPTSSSRRPSSRRWRRRSTAPRCSPTAPPGSATRARNVTREAAMAKLAATEGAQQVIDAAVQIFGGLGVRERRDGRAALPRDPRAAHLRGRDRSAAAHHRAASCSRTRPGKDNAMRRTKRSCPKAGRAPRATPTASPRPAARSTSPARSAGRPRASSTATTSRAQTRQALANIVAVLREAGGAARAHRAHDLVRDRASASTSPPGGRSARRFARSSAPTTSP